jgi:hypothetical protein
MKLWEDVNSNNIQYVITDVNSNIQYVITDVNSNNIQYVRTLDISLLWEHEIEQLTSFEI